MRSDERIALVIDSTIELDLLRRLEPAPAWLADFAAQGGEVIAVGPFRALLHPDALGLNYAAPTEPLGDAAEVMAALDQLRRLFAERKLLLRLEFTEQLFPELAGWLERARFTREAREPVLLMGSDEFRPSADRQLYIRFLRPDADESDLLAFQSIFREVLLRQRGQPSPEQLAQLRRDVQRADRRWHALATQDSRPVGIGFVSATTGICELARIGTVASARRRGIGAALVSFMLQDRFAQGDTLTWLAAENEVAQALYEKVGFRPAGTRLYYQWEGRPPSPNPSPSRGEGSYSRRQSL